MRRPAGEPVLSCPFETEEFFARTTPEYVFLAAGKSGGIRANQARPAELMRDNLLVECHVVHAAWKYRARKLLYLASSCSYPRDCPQPMRVGSLMTGPPEPTNEAYAVAKLAGISLCRAYRVQHRANFVTAIPANVFGPGDDFDPEESHVVPGLIRKMHEAKAAGLPFVDIWGTGTPRREFLYVEDLADACIFLMRAYDGPGPINIGGGTDVTIRRLAETVREVVGYGGDLRFDPSRPDGMPSKGLDAAELLALGWRARTPLRAALAATYEAFLGTETQPLRERTAG